MFHLGTLKKSCQRNEKSDFLPLYLSETPPVWDETYTKMILTISAVTGPKIQSGFSLKPLPVLSDREMGLFAFPFQNSKQPAPLYSTGASGTFQLTIDRKSKQTIQKHCFLMYHYVFMAKIDRQMKYYLNTVTFYQDMGSYFHRMLSQRPGLSRDPNTLPIYNI